MTRDRDSAGRRHFPKPTGGFATQVPIASTDPARPAKTLATKVDLFLANIRAA